VYDTDEWDPLEGFQDLEPVEGSLDLQFLEELGLSIFNMGNSYGLDMDTLVSRPQVEGEEVGDDRIDFTNDPVIASTTLVVQEKILEMVTSEADTNLSTTLWNFCETTSIVPLHPEQSFDRCRKVGEFEDLGFIDVPPLRILLDVMKGDRSHSSTAVGKVTMLGSRMRTPRTEFLSDFHLASYLQDGYLRTCRSTEPKYLPQIMGGSGCRAPFGESVNLYLSVHAFRGGRCQRIYGSATRELRQSLTSLEKGEAIMPILCRRLRDKQEYLHGTYAAKIFIPSKVYQDTFGRKLPEPIVLASGGSNLFTNFENRLIRTRHLVTRTSAEREWEFTTRIRASLLSRSTSVPETTARLSLEKRRARAEFGNALTANTALTNLLERKGSLKDVIQLTGENFHTVNCGATHFSRWDAEWLFFGGKSENFTIEDLTLSEDMFIRAEVSEDESLRVGSIPLRPIVGNQRMVRTTTSVGLYQIGSGMFEWATDLCSRLESHRARLGRALTREDALLDYEVNPEWVNDDSLIIARCRRDTQGRTARSTYVVLVSADKRLGHQLANTCNVQVFRVDPREYIPYSLRRGWDPVEEQDPTTLYDSLNVGIREKSHITHMYVDTGSVNAYLARVDSHYDGGPIFIRKPIESARNSEGKRTYRYSLTEVKTVGTVLRPALHTPVLTPKRYRTSPGDLAESSGRKSQMALSPAASRKSWRTGE
jgi:hypothetical protein